MPLENNQSPFDLLLDIDSRAKQLTRNYPIENETRVACSGIAFEIGGYELLVPIGEVLEIVTLTSLTRVPGVKPWVRGVANVRGTLIPVMDMRMFLYGQDVQHGISSSQNIRVIMVDYSGHPVGLSVAAVLGIRHYWKDEQVDEISEQNQGIAHYVYSSYRRGEELMGIFDISRLLENVSFADVAA